MASGDCVFCRIAKKEIPAALVFEDDEIIAFEDMRPQAPVHIVLIPKRHIARTSDLAAADGPLAGRLILAAKRVAARKGVDGSGYRLVMNCNAGAGQEVFHLHLHLLGGRKFSWPPG